LGKAILEMIAGARKTTKRPSAPQTRFRLPEQGTLHNKSGTGKTGGIRAVGGSELPHWHVLPFWMPKYVYAAQKIAQVW
jgi:hypothetical protein